MAEDKGPQQGDAKQSGSLLRSAIEHKVEDLGLNQVDFVKEALKWQYNWIGLAGAALFALVSGTGMPLVLAAGLELIYVSLVPRSSRFRRLVRSWKYAEQKRQREMKLGAMFNEMPPELRTRYAALDTMCQAIRANYSRLSSTSQMFLEQMEQKLHGLLEAYLRLLYAYFQHSQYLETIDPEVIRRETAQLQRALNSDSPQVQEINRRRVEILTKRLERYDKVGENQKVVQAQCLALEDILELIRDQSVTMRDPQQVSDQLESLVHDVEQTEETVRQVESVFEMAMPDEADTLAPLPTDSSVSDSSSAGRARVRN
jgi:chorismate mutase